MKHPEYQACRLCPRECGVNREMGQSGFCGMTDRLLAARAALHMWEEPCISGEEGSGAVFFTGCSMGCVFCQNYEISHEKLGLFVDEKRLVEIFLELAEKNANNINLVTGDVYIPTIAKAIEEAKMSGLRLPFIWNTSSYVNVEALKMLDGLVDVYLPDFKFIRKEDAKRYAAAENYPEKAGVAIAEMVRQTAENGAEFDERGMIKKGVIVRHLLMPGGLLSAKMIVKELYRTYGDRIYLSLMNQYTPMKQLSDSYPELKKRVTEREYDELIRYAVSIGVKNGYMQEGTTAAESFIPPFNYEGIERK